MPSALDFRGRTSEEINECAWLVMWANGISKHLDTPWGSRCTPDKACCAGGAGWSQKARLQYIDGWVKARSIHTVIVDDSTERSGMEE
jgi:hypothetical protein